MDVSAIEIDEFARQLMSAHGDKAILEAAERARRSESQNQPEQAHVWRSVANKLKAMRGPHAS